MTIALAISPEVFAIRLGYRTGESIILHVMTIWFPAYSGVATEFNMTGGPNRSENS
jgi:hypothetical protein